MSVFILKKKIQIKIKTSIGKQTNEPLSWVDWHFCISYQFLEDAYKSHKKHMESLTRQLQEKKKVIEEVSNSINSGYVFPFHTRQLLKYIQKMNELTVWGVGWCILLSGFIFRCISLLNTSRLRQVEQNRTSVHNEIKTSICSLILEINKKGKSLVNQLEVW